MFSYDTQAHHLSSGITNEQLKCLAAQPMHKVKTYNGYYVNDCKFNTENHNYSKSTVNNEVFIKGSNLSTSEFEYFGKSIKVVKLEYAGWRMKQAVLFKWTWFDLTLRTGIIFTHNISLLMCIRIGHLTNTNHLVLATQAS